MDLLKKVETLLNATARRTLPRRGRRTILDEQEERVLAEIREALAEVQAQERKLYQRLKTEETLAGEAAERGDRENQQAHQRRAAELERQLEQEGIEALNIEEKLAALEEKLALAKEAVDRQAREAAETSRAAEEALAEGGLDLETDHPIGTGSTPAESPAEIAKDDDKDLAARKSRLSD